MSDYKQGLGADHWASGKEGEQHSTPPPASQFPPSENEQGQGQGQGEGLRAAFAETQTASSSEKLYVEKLYAEKEWTRVALNAVSDAVLVIDLYGTVTYLNRMAETLTGWASEDAIGKPLAEIFQILDAKTYETAANSAQRAIEENRAVGLAMNCVLIRCDGSEFHIEDSAMPLHDEDGDVTGAVIIFHDACQSQSMSEKMTYLAQHDVLTGLPNRVLLVERLNRAIGLAHRHHHQVGLIYLDLDDFKPINDTLGHALGDLLLQAVAERLSKCVRDTDTVCRQGGDEFVILLAEIDKPADAAKVAEKILSTIVEPYYIHSHEVHVSASVGISLYPNDGIDTSELMHHADLAMYHSKKDGRNTYHFFRPGMNAITVKRLFIESHLHQALKENEIFLNFQPKFDMVTGEVCGAEALVRWHEPSLGLVHPSEFVPVAQSCGLIVPIGQWVLHETCRQLQAWRNEGIDIVPVAVNISTVELCNKKFLESIIEILDDTGLEAHFLELEFTESSLMHDAKASLTMLESLHQLGLTLTIDNFGVGPSSISYLQRFPIDTVNIDQSFVHDMPHDADAITIVKAIIQLAKTLDLRVTAKGIETREHYKLLLSQQCEGGQGFLFSPPLAADDFRKFLVRDKMHGSIGFIAQNNRKNIAWEQEHKTRTQ
ncbi:EAL domain-containing protein [Vreelandella rituensis]|uniref:EAL domain-containing protein n=1 Tax=Vreelandella rituensis TaxID=2282306 RepID=A0A368U6X7_9GAMM|nr:EAL domain-containing protein [Halomonas rituensis]RCV92908.1 EAL domain-containing protein [Halomonas rituensis]